ncbi:MAG: HAMP domain-containing sensor histidine kinase [Acidobacteriota bacterium]|nr:HAMP domain-containing sensor histidine kinase [Acidobacteriota bacterium]
MNTKRNDIFWFIIIRLIVLTSLAVSTVIIQYSTDASIKLINPFFYLALGVYSLSIVYFILFYAAKNYTFQAYLQIFIDLLLITALIYISGGVKGSFYSLYIFEIIAASIIISKRTTYLVAALSAVFYGFLIDGMYYAIIPYLYPELSQELSLSEVLSNILTAWGAFIIVAFLINHLTGNLRKTRDELRLAQKELEIKKDLAVAGETSANLAHEIRNPLAAISGSVQILRDEMDLTGEQKHLMDIVVRESENISQSIEQFLNLASPETQTFASIDLPSVLKEILTLLKRSDEINKNYQIKGNYKTTKINYYGNKSQFKQIFWNLVKNALKAMPDGGTLTVDFTRRKKKGIQMKFADTGKGMGKEERERMFEPFYSGFDTGKGIGMAVVRRIVDDYNGKIHVSSAPNKGTEIVITLPGGSDRKRE